MSGDVRGCPESEEEDEEENEEEEEEDEEEKVSRSVFCDSLPNSLSTLSKSIRSLNNSLPVLARTGFRLC